MQCTCAHTEFPVPTNAMTENKAGRKVEKNDDFRQGNEGRTS